MKDDRNIAGEGVSTGVRMSDAGKGIRSGKAPPEKKGRKRDTGKGIRSGKAPSGKKRRKAARTKHGSASDGKETKVQKKISGEKVS